MESKQEMIPTVKIGDEVVGYTSKNGGQCSIDSTNLITYNDDCTDHKYWKADKSLMTKGNNDLIENKEKKKIKRSVCKIVWGVILIILSILGFIYPLRDLLIWDKLNMRPGLPPFEWWSHPPDTTKVKAYIFNVTNHERFILGLDDKINVQEVGPIVYLEDSKFIDIKFTENDTLTFKPQKNLVFLPEDTKYNLNDTVILPSSALLGLTSMLHGSENYFRRMGFRLLLKLYANNFFVKRTIYEALWDYKDTLMEASNSFSTGNMNPINMGYMYQMYELLKTEVAVKIGPHWGHENFFKIYSYKEMPQLSGYDMNVCLDNATNATEGILFPQYLKKEDVPLFFSKSLCRILPLTFDEERSVYGLTLYKYNFSSTVFDNKLNVPGDCRNDDLTLPSGLKDGSKCYLDFPMVFSKPHFNGADIPKDKYVTGLTPDPNKHALGYYAIEPLTGTPIQVKVQVQCNLQIHNINGLYSTKFDKFSNLVLPLVWFQFEQEGLPGYIMNFLYFTVIVLPILSKLISIILLICGFYIIIKQTDHKNIKLDTKQLVRKLKK